MGITYPACTVGNEGGIRANEAGYDTYTVSRNLLDGVSGVVFGVGSSC